jgi:hypothetical protein
MFCRYVENYCSCESGDVQARMNREAIADYDRLIALGPAATRDTQVCGHRFLAVHHGWHLSTILDFPHAGC